MTEITRRPTAHLIHGFVGAGKTTLAKSLERDLPAVRFSNDEWLARLFGADPPAETFAAADQGILEIMEALWSRCLILGVDVVLDLGFWSRARRDAVRAKLEALGAGYRLYKCSCPEHEAWARIERRNLLPGSLLITRPTFDGLKARFQPLEADEAWVAGPPLAQPRG